MALAGRAAELGALDALLRAAVIGSGGQLTLVGPPGSGKTTLAAAAAEQGRRLGLEVAGASPVRGRPGRLIWAQVLGDLGASAQLTDALLSGADAGTANHALRWLTSGAPRLIVLDDIDVAGDDAVEFLTLVGARLVTGRTAVVATSSAPLGVGPELRLAPLSDTELSAVLGELPAQQLHAVRVASRGLPGPARTLAGQLADLPAGRDPVVHLALHAVSGGEFLDIDDGVVRLLETALARAADHVDRALLLARIARELLGDPGGAARRRALMDEALTCARRTGDGRLLAEVLDARLHAVWDAAGAEDRLAGAAEIIELSRASGDDVRERNGVFWRFVALMELGRVDEAEIALAAFERSAEAAGDAEGSVMALARHAMLASLRGRFDTAEALADQVSERAHRIGLPDAPRLVAAVQSGVARERAAPDVAGAAVELLYRVARRLPGHFYEATAARILAQLGRRPEAAGELARLLTPALAASGPRWLGVITDLSCVAVEVADRDAAAQLYAALAPYQGRLVMWGGANASNGPASYYLGVLATLLDRPDDAVAHLEDATAMAERIGALPVLAHGLVALGEALRSRAGAGDVQRSVDVARRGRDLASRLGMTVLLRRLVATADEWTLRRDGDSWLLVAGEERVRLPDSRGLQHLRTLLAAPRREVSVLDLAAGGAGLRATDAAPILDPTAVASYRTRLTALEAELAAADASGDVGRATQAEAERQALLGELRRASGLGGRMRRTTTESERARVNVTRTLRAALGRIASAAPRAGAHLQASVQTGLACRYDPAPGGPTRWNV